jgi:C-terminal processing protease CtpA/Prc
MAIAPFPLRIFAIGTVIACSLLTTAQDINAKRDEARRMADEVANDIAKHYYDPTLRGVDWKAKLLEAKEKIDVASSSNAAFANIAAMIDSLGDSHTFFIPPLRSFTLDYGWRMQTIGERCFVMRIRPETDAATKLHAGDEILAVNDYKPTPANLHRIEYVLDVLRPQSKVDVTVRSPAGEIRKAEIEPKVFNGQLIDPTLGDFRLAWEQEHKIIEPHFAPLANDVLVVRIPEFFFGEDEAGKIVSEARKHKSVILDLRGNPGGRLDSLSLLVSGFFDHEVKIADRVEREDTKPQIAKPLRRTFSGKLVVLVDSRSASAGELFARLVQLEKRGVVMGDRTIGMVMAAQPYGHAYGGVVYGVSVTVANLIMSDGKSLEHVGVTPDEISLPTASDIANERDTVLAHAAALAGAQLSPEDAAKLFPYQWQQPFRFSGH